MENCDSITIGTNADRAVAYIEQITSNKTRIRMEYGPKSTIKLAWWLLKASVECVFIRTTKKLKRT